MSVANKMDPRKQYLVMNVISFLQDELVTGNLSEERKESIEVAIQCLESAFELDDETRTKLTGNNRVNLLALLPMRPEINEQLKIQADEFKNQGNIYMRNGEYIQAVEEYTKAIELNAYNAVYFCNRAAAYSRMDKHLSAIADCKAAIKLDPTYGKAYGRLGIAYTHLKKFEEARNAFENALKHDPGNAMYETNLRNAEEKSYAATVPEQNVLPTERPLDINQFINNPHLVRMATEMLSNTNFRDMINGIITAEPGEANMDALFQAGEVLAQRMQTQDPNFVENLHRTMGTQASTSTQPPESDPKSGSPNNEEEGQDH